jgi:ubiquinone/menaquinone biosynthesis C-methylase UbiE
MDYQDHDLNMSDENFYFKGKNELKDILLSKLNKKNIKILVLGIGVGEEIKITQKYGEFTVVDNNKKVLDLLGEDIEKKLGDASDIPYPSNYFNLVMAFDVLEHVEDDRKSLSEIHRVLQPNGSFIFTVPAYQFLFSSHDRALNHKRRYNKQELKSKLSPFFNKVQMGCWNSLLLPLIAISRIKNKTQKNKIDDQNVHELLDKLFYSVLHFENKLIKRGKSFPFGLSLWGIFEKSKKV